MTLAAPKPWSIAAWFAGVLAVVSLTTITGCQQPTAKPQEKKLPEVFVSEPVTDKVTEFEEFTGHLVATKSVVLRSRVSGYLDALKFEDGARVKKGDLLFVIDDRQYRATASNAKALHDQAAARLENVVSQDRRARTLLNRNAIPTEESETLGYQRSEAESAVNAARAAQELADLNVTFTEVRAPIDGVISNRQVDPGNLVKADDTILATIVTQAPIYAYFDVNERTFLRLQRMIRQGDIARADEAGEDKQGLQVMISLADEDDFTHKGRIDFLDNQLDANTGTLRVRAVLENKDELLTPGLFVRVRFPVGPEHEALLVQEQALGTDQGQRFLYVLDSENKVTYRRVKIGWLDKGRRVIQDGLKPGDRVVVNGLQRIRPGDQVAPKSPPTSVADQTETQPHVTLVSDKSAEDGKSAAPHTQAPARH
jgi:multidrug efflux system membrane fusion protein